MAEWQSGDVQVNGIRIHFYRTGGDKPPVVLAHGVTDDGLCWTRLARALETEYDVIMPDARGHGLSEAPVEGYDSRTMAADLAGLIRALGLERPVVGGHSMGGQMAFRLAAEYPDLIRGAFLEDPVFRTEQPALVEAEQSAHAVRWRQNIEQLQAMTREEVIETGRQRHPDWSEEELGPWADAKLRVSPHFAGAVRAVESTIWRDLLPRIRVPLLLITGDPERGAIVTPGVAREARELLPSLQVVQLAGAGHNLRREQFDRYLGTVRAFLRQRWSESEGGSHARMGTTRG